MPHTHPYRQPVTRPHPTVFDRIPNSIKEQSNQSNTRIYTRPDPTARQIQDPKEHEKSKFDQTIKFPKLTS